MDTLIKFTAQYLIVAVIAIVAFAWYKAPKENKWRFAFTVAVAGVIALVLARLASKMYYDPRPFVTQNVQPLFYHAPNNGFPSDHSLLAMALSASVYFFNKKLAWIMLALTALIGIARVLAKVHSPIDIVGAWVIGIIGAVAGYCMVKYYWSRRRPANNLDK